MEHLIIKVSDMNCQHCTSKITAFLQELSGVKEVQCNLDLKEVQVSFTPPATKEQIIDTIQECGFEAE